MGMPQTHILNQISMEGHAMDGWGFALSPEMLNEYLTTEEAAQVLKVGKSTLEQARLNGGGPRFTKFGKKIIRYRMDDIVSWGKTYSSTSEYERAA
jgi:excisionase family DNA binding protein